MFRVLFLTITHAGMLAVGFLLGVYLLPILTAAPPPDASEIQAQADSALFDGAFTRERAGSDFLHWGEGTISVSPTHIGHEGSMAPGPDYKLYLVKGFVEDEAGFEAQRTQSVLIGDVKAYNGFVIPVPQGIDVTQYSTVLVWCESFGEFITSAQYQ